MPFFDFLSAHNHILCDSSKFTPKRKGKAINSKSKTKKGSMNNSDKWCQMDPASKMCFGREEDCIMDMTLTLISEDSGSMDSNESESHCDTREEEQNERFQNTQARYVNEVKVPTVDRGSSPLPSDAAQYNEVPVVGSSNDTYHIDDHQSETTARATGKGPGNEKASSGTNTGNGTSQKDILEQELAAKISLVEKALQDVEKVRKHYEQQYAEALKSNSLNDTSVASASTITDPSASETTMTHPKTMFENPNTMSMSRPASAASKAFSTSDIIHKSSRQPAFEIKPMYDSDSPSGSISTPTDFRSMRNKNGKQQHLNRKRVNSRDSTLATLTPNSSASCDSSQQTSQEPSSENIDYSNETAGERLHRKAMERNARLKKLSTKKEKVVPKTPYSEKAGNRLHQKAMERQRRLDAIALKNSRFPAHLLDRSKPGKKGCTLFEVNKGGVVSRWAI